MTASIATYPHEVVRTRLQTQRLPLADDASSDGMVKSHLRRGIIYTARKMVVKEGWESLYKGLSINLFRTVPNSIVTILSWVLISVAVPVALWYAFISYEFMMSHLQDRRLSWWWLILFPDCPVPHLERSGRFGISTSCIVVTIFACIFLYHWNLLSWYQSCISYTLPSCDEVERSLPYLQPPTDTSLDWWIIIALKSDKRNVKWCS